MQAKSKTTAREAAEIPATIASFDSLPASAYVRLPTVCALFGIGPATVWRWSESGRLPRPKKIGERVSGWQVGELRGKLQAIAA
jgi:predicted DNA-binding transcriptional regulator AlpA